MMWALLWGVGLVVAFLAGFIVRGRIPRSGDARGTAGDAVGSGDGEAGPVDAVEAAAKAGTRAEGPGVGLDKVKALRPGRAPGGRGIVAIAVCLGLVGGLWACWPGGSDESSAKPVPPRNKPSPSAKPTVAWQVPATGGRYDEQPGAWGLGDAVVQGRIDGLSAYAARDGAVRWTLRAPTREAVCTMSPSAARGVGLIAYGKHDEPCATLLAVRTSDGEVLWQRSLTGDGIGDGGLALAGSTAVVAEDGALRARSTESGAQLWQRAMRKSCEAKAVGATTARTLLVEQCGTGARLVALDTRTGKERWVDPLPVESEVTASVVSVAPVVLAVSEEDQRGTRALLGFDDRGAATVTVPLSGPAGELVAPTGVWADSGSEGRPLVMDDLVITLAERDELVPDVVVAHSLKSGRKVWEYKADPLTTDSLAREPDGRIGVLADNGDGGLVILLDRDGTERGRIAPAKTKSVAVSIRPELIPVTGGHVVVNHVSTTGEPGVFALR